MIKGGNLFADIGPAGADETFATLAERPGAAIERIVSTGQASPEGFWYDQDWTEWVVVLAGEAAAADRGRGGAENPASGRLAGAAGGPQASGRMDRDRPADSLARGSLERLRGAL